MIEFENVSFSYTGQEHGGLHDINLKISDGECVLFCGRSGCGKTTITRLVNGLIPQFYQGDIHGRVLVDGQEISNIPMYQIAAKVGSVFQNPRTQFFNVDTDSEIAFGIENEARPPKKLAERVEQTTEDLHIQKLRNRNIFELSGGEKQKIAFASVYAMNPQIYLLDEPSSNLDMTSIQELREHLRLIKKQGKTVLIAEHRLYYLMELADQIVYLEKGEIKGIYTPEEFRQLSEHEREHMGLRAVDLQAVFPPKAHLPALTPVLELRNVTLRYKKQTILHDIVLSAGKGEVIGVVGHNGAGKTTFSRALCGLHKNCDVPAGIILLIADLLLIPGLWLSFRMVQKYGKEKNDICAENVSSIVEYVSGIQTFRAYGVGGMKNKTVINAMREFSRISFVYEAKVLPIGTGFGILSWLSCPLVIWLAYTPWAAGTLNTVDCLLICMLPLFCAKLANSIFVDLTSYKNLMISKNKILGVMNEPEETGSMEPLHTTTHEIIFDNVDFSYLLKEKKTVVMIAHTLSIVKNADQILVMGDGRIAESGTHEELLAKGGKYAAMWNAEQKISA